MIAYGSESGGPLNDPAIETLARWLVSAPAMK
jgi:hypothetical protein